MAGRSTLTHCTACGGEPVKRALRRGLCGACYEKARRAAHRRPRAPRPTVCAQEDCERPVAARKLCSLHYDRQYRGARPRGTLWRHGTSWGYRRHECRCDDCCAAYTEENRKHHEKARRRAGRPKRTVATTRRPKSTNPRAIVLDMGSVSVVHWPKYIDGRWTCPDCGETFFAERTAS